MAGKIKVGRNDRCPCGSGHKYKNCCEGKANRISIAGWVAILTVLVAAGIVGVLIFTAARSDVARIPTCPPGQVWSAEHGHCHVP